MDYNGFLTAVKDGTLRLSFSSLSRLDKSPRHFADYYMRPMTATASMTYGSLVHCLVLEPERFDERYAIAPNVDRRTKAGKLTWAAFKQSSEGLATITEQQYDEAVFAIKGLKKCKAAMQLITTATKVEQDLNFNYKGLDIKGIRDLENPHFVCDLKTTQDASVRSFRNSIYRYNYNLQAAIYTFQCLRPYYFIALEKSGNCAVYELGEELRQKGRDMFEKLIVKYKRCRFVEAWEESYGFDQPDGIVLID